MASVASARVVTTLTLFPAVTVTPQLESVSSVFIIRLDSTASGVRQNSTEMP